jgi:hypothetical protein
MERLDVTSIRALRVIFDGQPMSPGKLEFAWRIAAGPSLARAATLSWTADGTLHVRARSEDWRREILRARGLIAARLSQLLGDDAVRRMAVSARLEAAPDSKWRQPG